MRRAYRRWVRRAAIGLVAAAPLACAPVPAPVGDSFFGTWATAQNDRITFLPTTIVQNEPGSPGRAFDKTTCGGVFRFAYTTKAREALSALLPYQPGLRQKLDMMLHQPRYPVAELACDRGDQTYVLLRERQIVAIYRDGDIGAIERLGRR